MALRTFRFNPALGGFGGESSNDIGLLESNSSQKDDEHRFSRSDKTRNAADRMMRNNGDNGHDEETATTNNNSNLVQGNQYHHADAFAQIIKELVDNSVDACAAAAAISQTENDSAVAFTKRSSSSSNKNNQTTTTTTTGNKTKTTLNAPNRRRRLRVRVTIEPWVDDERSSSILQDDDDDDCSQEEDNSARRRNGEEILRVTVLDNGAGMEDIETCVDPFRTTKAHNNNNQNSNNKSKDDSNATTAGQTAGRYGIGLTLCLLHAQRLVPNSRASIQSTTAQQSYWSVVNCVVDTNGDSVRCFPNIDHTMAMSNEDGPPVAGRRPKSFATESGTAVSVLVPGGATAALAWPRLAEYFARFKLSRGLCCCLEVLAPTLSKIPLQVVPPQQLQQQQQQQQKSRCRRGHGKQQQQQEELDSSSQQSSSSATKTTGSNLMNRNTANTSTNKEWSDFFDGQNSDQENSLDTENVDLSQASKQADKEKEKEDPRIPHDDDDDDDRDSDDDDDCVIGQVCRAAELYLGRPIPRSNVASSIVPIRHMQQQQQRKGSSGTQNSRKKKHVGQDSSPQLEVDVIVHGPTTMDDDQDEDEDALPWNRAETAESSDAASMVLVRMVNRIPLLDSAEAIACGLVQGLASKKQMWNTFGLQVTHHVNNHSNLSRLPVYEVKDSAQVAPFFENHSRGGLLDDDGDSSASSDFEPDPEYDMPRGNRRKRKPKGSRRPQRQLHPAQIRLGNILVIVQIHADPSNLPLPTLSKGRLPFENSAIDTALEVALTNCLRQLQRSNPDLLLTAHELRKVERDVRYVPALSMAVASILAKSNTDEAAEYRDTILKWNTSTTTHSSSQEQSQHHHHDDDDESSKEASMKSNGNDNNVHLMCKLLEDRLRHVLTLHEAGNGKRTTKKKPGAGADDESNVQNDSQESNPYDGQNGDDAMEYDDILGSPDDDDAEHDDPLDLFESSNSNSAYHMSESQASQASTAVLSRRKEEEDDEEEEEEENDYDEWL